METLAFFHVFKNGGTTLVDRYKHNSGFVYQRIPHNVVINYQQPGHTVIPVDDFDFNTAKILFGHGVNFQTQIENVTYATCLRDPIERIISAYNYFKLETKNIWKRTSTIDFATWFRNKSVMSPTPTYWQYQHFSQNINLMTDYGRQEDLLLSHDLYSQAIENISKFQHVLFLDDNYIDNFDKIASKFDCYPDTSVVHQHRTAIDLNHYTCYNDLDPESKQLLHDFVSLDMQFYNHCKEKFK